MLSIIDNLWFEKADFHLPKSLWCFKGFIGLSAGIVPLLQLIDDHDPARVQILTPRNHLRPPIDDQESRPNPNAAMLLALLDVFQRIGVVM